MSTEATSYRGYRFRLEIISLAVCLYYRFCLSFRDVENLLAQRRIVVSYQPTRMRERQMRRFKSPGQAQRFLSGHGVIHNLFRVGRHLVSSANHRVLRARSFLVWSEVTNA